jgi:hypothetical protein
LDGVTYGQADRHDAMNKFLKYFKISKNRNNAYFSLVVLNANRQASTVDRP